MKYLATLQSNVNFLEKLNKKQIQSKTKVAAHCEISHAFFFANFVLFVDVF